MAVDAISNNQATIADLLSGSERVPQKTLGQKDFFKLLSTQLASQDPLKPMEDTSFIAQMASFSSLDGMTKLTDQFATFNSRQDFASAQNLLGKKVTLLDSKNTEVSGVVSAVYDDGDGTKITVDGASYSANSVYRVQLTSNPAASN